MTTAAAPIDTPCKDGVEISIGQAATQVWRGAAAAVILGTGFATPLVVGTPGTQFIGVFLQSQNNTGAAGSVFCTVRRKGIFPFSQTGITQANVMERAYFTDDNTVSTTANGNYAGLIVTVDANTKVAWVEIDDAVIDSAFDLIGNGAFPLGASGAINPHVQANYLLTKAGIAAMTLAAPTAGLDDFKQITITSNTANQHTITATGLFLDGAGHNNVATFPTTAGASLTLMAFNGKWLVISNANVVMS